jgi:uncharacterized protein YbaR (Trm112 family)
MDKRLLAILVCPVTHKGLSLASSDLLGKVNKAISAGELQNAEGAALAESFREALVTDDGALLYPINDGIPVLLESESILLRQLS